MVFFRIILLSLFLSIGALANGQASHADTIRMLCQTWMIKEVYIPKFEENEKDELNDYINNTRMQFIRDWTVIMKDGPEQMKGKWELKGKNINILMEEGTAIEMTIISLSIDSFHFESRNPGSDELVTSALIIPEKK